MSFDNDTATVAASFDPALFADVTLNTAVMTVVHPVTKAPTPWKITFAGPGHPQIIALDNRLARKGLQRRATQEAARVNGRKWKPEDKQPDDARRENAEIMVDQIVGWEGCEVAFSRDAAINLLLNPKMGLLIQQIDAFLEDEKSFINSSVTS